MVTLPTLEALRHHPELLAAAASAQGDAARLALGERLRREHPGDLVAAAFEQAELRARAADKLSRAGSMWLTRDGLEQAAGEPAARHRAARLPPGPAVDLCCGIGGDLLAVAAGRGDVLAVDRDPLHLRMAVLNAGVYGVGAGVRAVCADVRAVDLTAVEVALVDPARRRGGSRLAAGSSEPPLAWCLALADRVPAVAVKAAPGLSRNLVPAGWEMELVADGRDLKEAVLWSPALAQARTRATVLGAASLTPVPGDPVPVAAPGQWLLDPSPAVTRAGLVEDLARLLGAWKIDERVAFLSTDRPVLSSYSRLLHVDAVLAWSLRAVAAELRRLDVGAVDIRQRGLGGDVEDLRRRLRLTGRRRVTLVMTRVSDRPTALVCTDPPAG